MRIFRKSTIWSTYVQLRMFDRKSLFLWKFSFTTVPYGNGVEVRTSTVLVQLNRKEEDFAWQPITQSSCIFILFFLPQWNEWYVLTVWNVCTVRYGKVPSFHQINWLIGQGSTKIMAWERKREQILREFSIYGYIRTYVCMYIPID